MKILYGLAGEGFGHSSRARTVIPYLEKKGYEVNVMTYGQAYNVLKNEFDVFKIRGSEIVFEKGKLRKRKTLKKSLNNFFSNIRKSKEIYNLMKNKFDLCISDMEPVVPILSNWYRLPLISLDNQHRLVNLKLDIPKKYKKEYIAARAVVKTFAGKADDYIITSYGKAKVKFWYKKKTYIVPPIIRPKIQKLKPTKEDKILVYSTKKNNNLLQILKKIDEKFIVYGWNKEKKDKNLVFHKSGDKFLKDLEKCKAVIGSAGFTLISESLYLKKPYFALPLQGQFEQVLNALFLKNSGLGEFEELDNLNDKKFNEFLNKLDKYEKKLNNYNPDYDKLFKVLDVIVEKYNP